MSMSPSEYSRHRGTTPSAVNKALESGRIEREPDGTIDEVRADGDWEQHTNAAKVRGFRRRDPIVDFEAGKKRRRTASVKNADAAKNLDSDKLGRLSFADARALRENFNAKMTLVQLEEKIGSLLPRDKVAVAIESLFRVHRDAILNIPNRIAGQVLELPDTASVQDLIESELRQTLEELAEGLNGIVATKMP
jgi:hypothetical protein